MNKQELISAMSEKTDLPKKNNAEALEAMLETITGALKKDDKVQLVGFGTFEAQKRAAREGINPRTKEKIKIQAVKAPAFKSSKVLKEELNK